jgi:membrane protein implicated in regulation of membrane protease activity
MSYLIQPTKIERFDPPIIGRLERAITSTKKGRVAALATSWNADFYAAKYTKSLQVGDAVVIVGRSGNTLLIGGKVIA